VACGDGAEWASLSIYVYNIDLLSAVFGFGFALAGLALGQMISK